MVVVQQVKALGRAAWALYPPACPPPAAQNPQSTTGISRSTIWVPVGPGTVRQSQTATAYSIRPIWSVNLTTLLLVMASIPTLKWQKTVKNWQFLVKIRSHYEASSVQRSLIVNHSSECQSLVLGTWAHEPDSNLEHYNGGKQWWWCFSGQYQYITVGWPVSNQICGKARVVGFTPDIVD